MEGIRGEFAQGFEDKLALVHQGMRNGEGGLVNDRIAEQNDVEVDGPWAPAFFSHPAEHVFYFLKLAEEVVWKVLRFDLGHGVEVVACGGPPMGVVL